MRWDEEKRLRAGNSVRKGSGSGRRGQGRGFGVQEEGVRVGGSGFR